MPPRAAHPRLLPRLLLLLALAPAANRAQSQFSGGPLLRRIGISFPCVDDPDQVLAALWPTIAKDERCRKVEYNLRGVGGCAANLEDGVGMGSGAMAAICPVHCRACPDDNVFPEPPARTTMHRAVMGALGPTERARGGAVCNGAWELLQRDAYCAGQLGADLVDVNPTARPMTLEECEAAVLAEPSCGDVFASNAGTNPTGGGHPSEHFHCRCAHVDAPRGCRSKPSAHGTALYRCQRTLAAGGETGRPDAVCATGYPHRRRVGTAPPQTPCMLPFMWRGVLHHECTDVDGNRACVDLDPPWVGVVAPTRDGKGAGAFAYKGMGCSEWAAGHCEGGELGWWVTSVPVDRYGRRADEACCECGGGRFSGEPVHWCLTSAGGEWGECGASCPRGHGSVVSQPPARAHCAPLTSLGADAAGAPGSNGQPGGAMAALMAGVYDLSDCRSSTMGVDGISVPVVAVGTECRVGCADGRRRVGPPAVFSCGPNNTSPDAEPSPYALGGGGALSELPTCFEMVERNSLFSPPQGISVRCAEAFNKAIDCTHGIMRRVCGTRGDKDCKAGPNHCDEECQLLIDAMFAACDSEDGWASWKVGLAAEVGRLAGCGGAFHAAPALAMLAALWLGL